MQEPPPAAAPPLRPWLLALALAGLVLVAYRPALDAGFELFDDNLYVTENAHVQAGLSLAGVRWALGATEPSNWHPLTLLSHQLDVELYGLDPRGHHLTSVLLHAACAATLFLLLLSATGAVGRSIAAAALFALHPLRVESVAWIAERKDVLSGLLFLLALAAYARWAARPGAGRLALLLAAFAAALAAKSMAVTLPLVALLADVWPLGRLRPGAPGAGRDLLARLREKWPLFALSAFAAMAAVRTQGGAIADLVGVPLGLRLANAPIAIVDYLRRTLWPFALAPFYPLPTAIPWPRAAAAAALVLAITALALAAARRVPAVGVGWLAFLAMLLPVLGLVQVGNQASADRYTYLPSVGLAVAVAWGAAALATTERRRRTLTAVVTAALILLALATSAQATLWRDSATLWSHTLAVSGPSFLAHHNLGLALARAGRTDAALVHLRAAVALRPAYGQSRAALGSLLLSLDRPEEAREQFVLAVERDPGDPRKLVSLAQSLERLGRLDEAAAALEAALVLDPGYRSAQEGLAEVRARLGGAPAGDTPPPAP